MRCLVLAGNDKLGRKLLNQINDPEIIRVLDKSLSLKRITRLLISRNVSLVFLFKVFLAEFSRPNATTISTLDIKTNQEILQLINENEVDVVLMFRVGLIIRQNVIDSRAKIINVHCASLPKYGGLASIDLALKNHDYQQEATMHFITRKVDEGQTVATKQYQLDPQKSYRENEDQAFLTGMQLLLEQLSRFKNMEKLSE